MGPFPKVRSTRKLDLLRWLPCRVGNRWKYNDTKLDAHFPSKNKIREARLKRTVN